MASSMSQMTYIQVLHLVGIILIGTFVTQCILYLVSQLLTQHSHSLYGFHEQRKRFVSLWTASNCSRIISPNVAARRTPAGVLPARGYLEKLPTREESAKSFGLASTAQYDMRNATVLLAEENPDTLYLGRSTFESEIGDVSLYAKRKTYSGKTEWRGKVLESSHADGLVETKLHPADAKLVIDMGWGRYQRPSWNCTPWTLSKPEDVCVEARSPRDQEEVEVVKQIVRAGAWWGLVQIGGDEEEKLEGKAGLEA